MSNNKFVKASKEVGNVLLHITGLIAKELVRMNENYANKIESLDRQGVDFWSEAHLKRRYENATDFYEKLALLKKMQERKADNDEY